MMYPPSPPQVPATELPKLLDLEAVLFEEMSPVKPNRDRRVMPFTGMLDPSN
jgi:hypothetical protein